MSIVTRTGDDGTTGLMYNRRVPKTHARVEAYGTMDECNAAIGLARAHAPGAGFVSLGEDLRRIQKQLVVVMGEVATSPEDLGRYATDGFELVQPAMTARLESLISNLEAGPVNFRGWATPGENLLSAALDVARTACRRAERRLAGLREAGELGNGEILLFMNRLSDLLWLQARWVETRLAEPGEDAAGSAVGPA